MTPSDTYRDNAATQRAAAKATNLPNRREMHERAADAWDVMADAVDDTKIRAAINAAARAA